MPHLNRREVATMNARYRRLLAWRANRGRLAAYAVAAVAILALLIRR